jgi:hypothetical protein
MKKGPVHEYKVVQHPGAKPGDFQGHYAPVVASKKPSAVAREKRLATKNAAKASNAAAMINALSSRRAGSDSIPN